VSCATLKALWPKRSKGTYQCDGRGTSRLNVRILSTAKPKGVTNSSRRVPRLSAVLLNKKASRAVAAQIVPVQARAVVADGSSRESR
jgi:hypothetical protein